MIEIEQIGMQHLMFAFDVMEESLAVEAEATMEEICSHAEERAAANAPILLGHLRQSIDHDVHREGRKSIVGEVVAHMPYALMRHEAQYDLGPVSAAQPSTPEGSVGRKFIERVIDHHAMAYEREMMKAPGRAAAQAAMKALRAGEPGADLKRTKAKALRTKRAKRRTSRKTLRDLGLE